MNQSALALACVCLVCLAWASPDRNPYPTAVICEKEGGSQAVPQKLTVGKHCAILKLQPGYYEYENREALPQTLCAVEGLRDSFMVPKILLAAPLVFKCSNVTFNGFLILHAIEASIAAPASLSTLAYSSCAQGDNISIAETANMMLENCHSNGGGGGLFANNLDISGNIVFRKCTATGKGGAVYAERQVNIRERAFAIFRDCSADAGGGLYVGGTLNVAGRAFFRGCGAHTNGGGAYVKKDVIIWKLAKATFIDCSAGNDGGGLKADGDVIVSKLARATFIGCMAIISGGGLWARGMFDVSEGAVFKGCQAGQSGGGFRCANLTLGSSNFSGCSAEIGGAGYASGKGLSLTGEMWFDGCQGVLGGAGLAAQNISNTDVTLGSDLSLNFMNMCRYDSFSNLLFLNLKFEGEPKFTAQVLNVSGHVLQVAHRLGLNCRSCPFGKFSFATDAVLETTCTACDPLYKAVNTDNSTWPCGKDSVELPEGISLTKHHGRYDAWMCPNRYACASKEIHTSADLSICADGYKSSWRLPACATCEAGYGRSQYDPFVCLKCSSKMSLLTPLFFYLVAIYSAGKTRSKMSAIQNIAISYATMATSSLSVLRAASSVQQLEAAASVYINAMIHVGSLPVYSPSSACLLPECTEFACAYKEFIAMFSLPLLYYPCAEILNRAAALLGYHFGPQGSLKTRLMVQAAIASNYFMPTLIGLVVKLLPCALIQYGANGKNLRRAVWFWSESCPSSAHTALFMLAIFGVIICLVYGPLYHCWLVRSARLGRSEELESALGFTLSIYHTHQHGTFPKYWDAVIMLRKMLFSSASMLFPLSYDASDFSLSTIGIMIFFLALHLYVRPYRNTDEHRLEHDFTLNRLEDLSIFTCLVSLLLSLSVKDSEHPLPEKALAKLIVIAVINTAAVMVMVYFFFRAAAKDDDVNYLKKKIGSASFRSFSQVHLTEVLHHALDHHTSEHHLHYGS